MKDLEPGSDAFPAERQAKELEARLRELGAALRTKPVRAASVAEWLLDQDFRGGRFLPAGEPAVADAAALDVRRADAIPRDLTLNAGSFGAELRRFVGDLREIDVAELLITSIESDGPGASPLVRTDVRYDIVPEPHEPGERAAGPGTYGPRAGR